MKTSQFVFAATLLSFAFLGCAQTNALNKPTSKNGSAASDSGDVTATLTPGDTKSLMYTVLSEISSLQPYMVNEQKFLDPKNEADIKGHIENLTKLSEKVIKTKKLQATGYRLSGDAIDSHFHELKYAFNSGNKKYARWMLSATPYACASCHTQLPNSPRPLWELKETDLSGTPFERADFLFATRNYNEAERIYTDLIRTYACCTLPNSSLDSTQIETALKRKLTIYVRIRRDFQGAINSFKTDLNNTKLGKEQNETINGWISQLSKLTKQDPKLPSKPIKVIAYASKVLEGSPRGFVGANYPRLVELLNASSLLYESLHEHPKDDLTASLLYWLGVSDLTLNNEFFFSLGPTYLKECMSGYSKTMVARRCYAEYDAYVKNLYTGTRGTDIPEEVGQELKYFKNLVGIRE